MQTQASINALDSDTSSDSEVSIGDDRDMVLEKLEKEKEELE